MPIRVMRKVGGEEASSPVCHSLVDFSRFFIQLFTHTSPFNLLPEPPFPLPRRITPKTSPPNSATVLLHPLKIWPSKLAPEPSLKSSPITFFFSTHPPPSSLHPSIYQNNAPLQNLHVPLPPRSRRHRSSHVRFLLTSSPVLSSSCQSRSTTLVRRAFRRRCRLLLLPHIPHIPDRPHPQNKPSLHLPPHPQPPLLPLLHPPSLPFPSRSSNPDIRSSHHLSVRSRRDL